VRIGRMDGTTDLVDEGMGGFVARG
jgi:hypothetical protein